MAWLCGVTSTLVMATPSAPDRNSHPWLGREWNGTTTVARLFTCVTRLTLSLMVTRSTSKPTSSLPRAVSILRGTSKQSLHCGLAPFQGSYMTSLVWLCDKLGIAL